MSSRALRDGLTASQVKSHVPLVDNSVAIAKYFQHCNQLYKEAGISYKKAEWRWVSVCLC
jgi:hypothetical protein